MSAHWKSYPDVDAAAEACATHILSVLEMALAGDGDATIAISGGSTPKLMFPFLVRAKFDWSRVHVFWVDERNVPPDHPESNYGMAEKSSHSSGAHPAPQRSSHSRGARAEAGGAALRDRDSRGLSTRSGTVAALRSGPSGSWIRTRIRRVCFPGEPLIGDREGIVAPVAVPHLNASRITLLPGVLLAARHGAVLVTGEDKAEAVHHIFQGRYEPEKYPAQIVAHHSRRATWFLGRRGRGEAADKLTGNEA